MDRLRSAPPGLRPARNDPGRFVATSTRSPGSCARLGVRPVELLIKSLNQLVADRRDAPVEAVRVMHESYGKEKMKLLQMCQRERERIIRAADRRPGDGKVSGLEADPADRRQTPGSVTYADLCLKEGPASRSSRCDAGGRDPDRSATSSFALGGHRHSAATEVKLDKITRDISRRMCVTVSERDRKIAALMLVKHQEEQARLEVSRQEEQKRQEARRREEAQRAQEEERRRKKLRENVQRWHEELAARTRLRERREKEKAGQLEQEVLVQEDRRRRLREEVEAQRREKLKAAQKEAAGRKCCQERLLKEKEEVEKREQERERGVAMEREQKARRSKVLQGKKERKRLQEENHRELLRHVLLKEQVEQRAKDADAQMKSALEEKLQNCRERRARAAEARLKELQERVTREEGQVQRAQLKAELESDRKMTHKQILARLSQGRAERAAARVSAERGSRARRARQLNQRRRACHRRLRDGMLREEEETRKARESYVSMKEWRRERLRRQQEQVQQEAQRLARASFRLREAVRRHTHSRTFDRMALEARLSHLKL